MIGRRKLLLGGGAGILGAGAVAYGGSLAVCSAMDDRLALIRPLFVALADIRAPESVGRAVLEHEGPERLPELILARQPLVSATLLPTAEARRDRLSGIVRDEFRQGDILQEDRWVVARSEALIAGAWVAGGQIT